MDLSAICYDIYLSTVSLESPSERTFSWRGRYGSRCGDSSLLECKTASLGVLVRTLKKNSPCLHLWSQVVKAW